MSKNNSDKQTELNNFFDKGFFDWQFSSKQDKEFWDERCYDEEKYWGGFSRDPVPADYVLPDWAIGPFAKYPGNPVFSPSDSGWDRGHFGGGVHNGSILKKDGKFYYIYRGERDIDPSEGITTNPDIDYICNIGIAVSDDGINFRREPSNAPIFTDKEDFRYSYEDVNVVRHGDTYYLFCNRWDWDKVNDPSACGVFLAVSRDLVHWEKKGLMFPGAAVIHRNPCVLQNPENEAVQVNGRFVMYINGGLIAYSDDLLHWESRKVGELWPGGEGCFALADYCPGHPDKILLFTGGHHTGHFYAIGEVLFERSNPEKPVEWLPRPVISVDPQYLWENGLSVSAPHVPVSHWRDTIFFTGMTVHQGEWRMYYGGSEYYTCLATAPANGR